MHDTVVAAFSTLDSGLRDETGVTCTTEVYITAFSTLDSGLRDETIGGRMRGAKAPCLSVPSTRVYAMKLVLFKEDGTPVTSFSTLDSGLRDETHSGLICYQIILHFQYPRLGSTR